MLKFILKFTFKQLQHVSILQLHYRQGAHSFMLTEVTVVQTVKIFQHVVNTVVVWLHILGPYWCTFCFQMFLQCHVHMNIFKKQTSSLMQLLLMHTEFGYVCNFYILLVSFCSSTSLYAINLSQYH